MLLTWCFLNAWAQEDGRAVRADPVPAPQEVARAGRVALVIGNDRYQHTQPLSAAVYDAELMAQALEDAGFAVTLLRDAELREMELALAELRIALSTAEVGLFYYSGHGLQIDGRNYLVPIDADLERPERVDALSIEVQDDLLSPMAAAGAPLNLVVLDACRNNPFARSWVSSTRELPAAGLGQVSAAPGFVIAYATSPGAVALDGRDDPVSGLSHGPYAVALAAEIAEPGQELQDVLKGTFDRVEASTQGQQIPWNSQAIGQVAFYFGEPPPDALQRGEVVGVVQSLEDTAPPDPGWRPLAGVLPGAVPLTTGTWTLGAQGGAVQLDGQSGDGAAVWLGGAQVAWAPRSWLHAGATLSGGGVPGLAPALYTSAWTRARLVEREHARVSAGLLVLGARGQLDDGGQVGDSLDSAVAGPFVGVDLGGERLRWDLTVLLPLAATLPMLTGSERWAPPPQSLLAALALLETGLRWRVTEDLTVRAGTLGCTLCLGASGRYRVGRWALNADFGRVVVVDGFYARVGGEVVF